MNTASKYVLEHRISEMASEKEATFMEKYYIDIFGH